MGGGWGWGHPGEEAHGADVGDALLRRPVDLHQRLRPPPPPPLIATAAAAHRRRRISSAAPAHRRRRRRSSPQTPPLVVAVRRRGWRVSGGYRAEELGELAGVEAVEHGGHAHDGRDAEGDEGEARRDGQQHRGPACAACAARGKWRVRYRRAAARPATGDTRRPSDGFFAVRTNKMWRNRVSQVVRRTDRRVDIAIELRKVSRQSIGSDLNVLGKQRGKI